MPGLEKLSFMDFIDLIVAIPSSDQKSKALLRQLPQHPGKFKILMKDWVHEGRGMTNFGGVAPVIVAMFAVCAMRPSDLKQQATKVSNKILTDGKTIWDLIIEGRGRDLKSELRSNSDFKNMLKLFFELEVAADLEKLTKDLLHLIGKIIVPEKTGELAGVIEHLTKSSKIQEHLETTSDEPEEKTTPFQNLIDRYIQHEMEDTDRNPLASSETLRAEFEVIPAETEEKIREKNYDQPIYQENKERAMKFLNENQKALHDQFVKQYSEHIKTGSGISDFFDGISFTAVTAEGKTRECPVGVWLSRSDLLKNDISSFTRNDGQDIRQIQSNEWLTNFCAECAWILYYKYITSTGRVSIDVSPAKTTAELFLNESININVMNSYAIDFLYRWGIGRRLSVKLRNDLSTLSRMIRNEPHTRNRIEERISILRTIEESWKPLQSGSNQIVKLLIEGLKKFRTGPAIAKLTAKLYDTDSKMGSKTQFVPPPTETSTAKAPTAEAPAAKAPTAEAPAAKAPTAKAPRYVPYTKSGPTKTFSGGAGIATVFWDTIDKEKVIVKVDKGLYRAKEMPRRERREQLTSVGKDCPYVAKIKNWTRVPSASGEEQVGMVMEYVHGGTPLIDAVRKYSSDTNKILEICKQLSLGLQAFANQGLIHPDIDNHCKNILIDRSGNVKIIDYDDVRPASGDAEKANVIAAVEQIGAILMVTNEELYKNLKNALGGKGSISKASRNDSSVRVDARRTLSISKFEELFKILDNMSKIEPPKKD